MTLAEQILADVATVIDLDDFAETATVGREGEEAQVPVQFDSDRFARLSGYTQYQIGTEATVMYAPAAQLPERKRAGDLLTVNGRDYTVLSWEERGGIAEISMQGAD